MARRHIKIRGVTGNVVGRGWVNDKNNENVGFAQFPFADVTAPTLIAHGTNEAIIPLEHATNAATRIAGPS
jgi:pimeloyl-ACP methyl ester carboxylesterase